jgi:hypothetical protein
VQIDAAVYGHGSGYGNFLIEPGILEIFTDLTEPYYILIYLHIQVLGYASCISGSFHVVKMREKRDFLYGQA